MTITDKFKDYLKNKVAEARLDLITQDGFMPLMISSTVDGVKEAEIDFDDISKEEASKLIQEYANKKPWVEAVALIFTAYTVLQKKDDKLGEDLSKEKEMMEAIMVYLYTREKSEYRRYPYVKTEDNKYNWFDDGWKEVEDESGLFSNPFKADPFMKAIREEINQLEKGTYI